MSDTLARIIDLLNVPLRDSGGAVNFPFDVERFCQDNDELLTALKEENAKLKTELEHLRASFNIVSDAALSVNASRKDEIERLKEENARLKSLLATLPKPRKGDWD